MRDPERYRDLLFAFGSLLMVIGWAWGWMVGAGVHILVCQ